MDLFVNCLPSFLHTKGTIEAFNANLNVVCEKPLARTVADFDKMDAAAKRANKLFAPFQNSRFYHFFQKMREVIDSGVLGDILHIRMSIADLAGAGTGKRCRKCTAATYSIRVRIPWIMP